VEQRKADFDIETKGKKKLAVQMHPKKDISQLQSAQFETTNDPNHTRKEPSS